MKIWSKIFLMLAGIGFVISILFRFLRPLAQRILPASGMETPIEPHNILTFVNTCLLFVIALALLRVVKQK